MSYSKLIKIILIIVGILVMFLSGLEVISMVRINNELNKIDGSKTIGKKNYIYYIHPISSWFFNKKNTIVRDDYIPMPLETRIIGSNNWISDTYAAIRIITLNHNDNQPIKGSRIAAYLSGEKIKEPLRLFISKTNDKGTVDKKFRVPLLDAGKYELLVKVDTKLGNDEVKEQITIEKKIKIMLTTDKPLYQPNQIINIRALALKKPSLEPASELPIIFEVLDPKGNKVFKKTEKLSKFGVASAGFQLADEINLGTYTVKATILDEKKKEVAMIEKKVNVQRYVLPKFKVQIKAEKSYYLPGERIKANIRADYFFGKPVAGGKVNVKLSSFDFSWNQFAELEGETDDRGMFDFDAKLPDYFAGLPLEKGNALLKVEAIIIDKAEHQESSVIMLPVAKEALLIDVIPENENLGVGLQNRFYILTSYPDGKLAKTIFIAKVQDAVYKGSTDKNGIGKVEFRIRRDNLIFDISAIDEMGNHGHRVIDITKGIKDEAIFIRPDKVIARVGDSIHLDIFSTKVKGTAYIDVLLDKQTYLTQSVEIMGGKASLDLGVDQGLVGTVLIHAYQIVSSGDMIRDSKVIYVNPAKDLKISMKADRDTYLPGKNAEVRFKVMDLRGHPVLAALGITIVDESVFAIEEMHPGLEKIYFTLEQELLKPRYEIHGFSASDVVKGVPEGDEQVGLYSEKQEVARVLFAAAMPSITPSINVNTYRIRAEKVKARWYEYLQKASERIWRSIEMYYKLYGSYPKAEEVIDELLRKKLLTRGDLVDPLGNLFKLEPRYGNDFRYGCTVISGGLDGIIGTNDDVYGYGYYIIAKKAIEEEKEKMDLGIDGGVPEVVSVTPVPLILTDSEKQQPPAGSKEQVYVRKFFPETLLVVPELITDKNGNASLSLKMADTITTWRASVLASSGIGQLGSATFPMRVFQDFFIDIDLPVSLTQNDEISIPVAIYNYLSKQQRIKLKIEQADWFDVLDKAETEMVIGAGDVSVRYFRIKVRQFGKKQLTIYAYGEKMNDAMQREIEVKPDGKEVWETINDRLERNVEKIINIPMEAIEGASNIIVKVYPGAFSQLIEGLDKLLRMPFGCFEQTSSITYPNVLVLDYMKRVNKINPEIQMKAEQYINLGYQRLLTFEVRSGGFSWFGEPPSNKVLTAYGLMEFSDMSKVYDVDAKVIERIARWLISQQTMDGSWAPDVGGIAEGVINRQTDILRTTAYITWALGEANYKGREIDRAVKYIIPRIEEVDDAYALAVIANALVGWDKNDAAAQSALDKLADLAVEENNVAYWKSKAPTSFGGRGTTGDLETTALAAYAFLKAGSRIALASKALTYLIQNRDAFGTWHSTQATIWSLKALIYALQGGSSETNAKVKIVINGKEASSFMITPADSDVMRQIDLRQYVKRGANNISIDFQGKGSALYQISSKYYIPWRMEGVPRELLSINVEYDRKELSVNDILKCKVKVSNNQNMTANMVIVDLGVPPGFEVLSEDLTELVNSKTIEKYSLTGRQVIIYLAKIEAMRTIEFNYRLKAKFPIKAKTPATIAYEYYAPSISGSSAPQLLIVK